MLALATSIYQAQGHGAVGPGSRSNSWERDWPGVAGMIAVGLASAVGGLEHSDGWPGG